MTDPIQTANPQQQGQHWWHADDIFAWTDDIFATIPQANIDDEDLSYGDMLEKKYHFNEMPEVQAPVQAPVQRVVQAPVQQVQMQQPVPQMQRPVQQVQQVQQVPVQRQVQPVQMPVAPAVQLQAVADKEIENIAREASIEQTKVWDLLDTKLQTDVQKKFGELYFTTKKIYELKDKLGFPDESFDILWADNDKIFISYRFLIDDTHEPILFITKIEQDKETEEEVVNELRFAFNEESNSLEVMINNVLLFDEIQDFTEDQKKKQQVVEKINKFTFLASEELRKIEKAIKEKEEAEKERRRLQDIFRNF